MFKSMLKAIGVSLGGLMVVLACEEPAPRPFAGDAKGVPCPKRHAVHAQELAVVMHELGRDYTDVAKRKMEYPQEVADAYAEDAARDQVRRLREAGELSEKLAKTAGCIAEVAPDLDLSEADRAAFVGYVEQLRGHADQLQAASASGSVDRMDAVMGEVEKTCTGCHADFTVLVGPLPESPL